MNSNNNSGSCVVPFYVRGELTSQDAMSYEKSYFVYNVDHSVNGFRKQDFGGTGVQVCAPAPSSNSVINTAYCGNFSNQSFSTVIFTWATSALSFLGLSF